MTLPPTLCRSPHPPHLCGAPSKQRGFVLIYVLGAVVLLSAVVMGASLAVRDRTTAVMAAKQQVQAEQFLRGALHTAAAKVALDIEIAHRRPTDAQLARALPPSYASWSASWAPQTLAQADQTYAAQVIPADWVPDANLLVADDWARLLTWLGVPPAQAQELALRVLQKRAHLLRLGSPRGFTHVEQLRSVLPLSPTQWFGRVESGELGLLDLLVLGTGKRTTDPNQTPLPIYRALYNARDDRLERLARLRAAGPVTAAQEAEVLGLPVPASPPPAAAATTPPRLFRLMVYPQALSGQHMTTMALLSVQPGQVSILHEYTYYRE